MAHERFENWKRIMKLFSKQNARGADAAASFVSETCPNNELMLSRQSDSRLAFFFPAFIPRSLSRVYTDGQRGLKY